MSINSVTQGDLVAMRYGNQTFDKYQNLATSSANYPGKGTALGVIYLTGKLNSEAGEMAGQVFKAMRDDGFMQPWNTYDMHGNRTSVHDTLPPNAAARLLTNSGTYYGMSRHWRLNWG